MYESLEGMDRGVLLRSWERLGMALLVSAYDDRDFAFFNSRLASHLMSYFDISRHPQSPLVDPKSMSWDCCVGNGVFSRIVELHLSGGVVVECGWYVMSRGRNAGRGVGRWLCNDSNTPISVAEYASRHNVSVDTLYGRLYRRL